MSNILLLTNIYPTLDKSYTGTPVCHFFAREWVKMGHHVRVAHFESLFPRPFLWVGSVFKEFIKAKTGCVVYPQMPKKDVQYEIDGVRIHFVPIKKIIPHSNFKERNIQSAFNQVCKGMMEDGFVPDIITAHFALPQLQMLHLFKQRYSSATTCLVLHSGGESLPEIYPDYKTYMGSVDVWGFRSEAFKRQFEQLYGVHAREFLCYSGIPDDYIQPILRDFQNGVHNFSFVGSLYKLKRVEDTINALHQSLGLNDFTFDIVGEGAESTNLKALVEQLGMRERVVFHGQMSRDEAQRILSQTDCFVMVSSREAFGLVYVEAMAKGCIVVATRGQGIDGIIEDGKNGFLCASENVDELSSVIKNITNMSASDLAAISSNAFETANNLTNRKVAEVYLAALMSN